MKGQRGFAAAAAAVFVLLAAGIRGLLRRYEIADHSMEPTLTSGDYVIAQRLRRSPKRGDIVILDHPSQPDIELVKRIVGLQGERLEIANGQVHVNGSVLAEPWADGPTRPDGSWEIGVEAIFLLGDRRPVSSADSRELGPVPVSVAGWKVVCRYWPIGRIGHV